MCAVLVAAEARVAVRLAVTVVKVAVAIEKRIARVRAAGTVGSTVGLESDSARRGEGWEGG